MKRFLLLTFMLFSAFGLFAQNMVSVTMNVDMNLHPVDPAGLSLAGGTGFGTPGDNLMTDPDGDGVYSITLMREVGFTSNYTFVNGPEWIDKEQIAGLPCADAGNFNDRLPITLNQDTVINTCFGECTDDFNCTPPPPDVMVTFSVDMTEYPGTFTTPELNGTFNGWCGNCNPMTDDDMDGVWEITLPLTPGSYEYKFSHDNWGGQEDLALAGGACTVTNGSNINRAFDATEDMTLETVCWESCNACGVVPDMVSITMNVNMNEFTVDPAGVSLAGGGGGGFGFPGDNLMEDPDGDGVYSITLMREAGFTSNYTFVNGSGWGDKEDIAGLPCSDPSSFDDRLPLTVNQDTVINTCFQECTDDLNCTPVTPPDMVSVTFNVNMNEYIVDPEGVSLAGGSAFGTPGDNPMLDPDGDGVYSITLMRPIGTVSNYTFVNGSGWGDKENIVGLPCSDPDNFDDRLPVTLNQDTVINTCFAECTDDLNCTSVNLIAITFNVNMSEYTVSADGLFVGGGSAFGGFNDNAMEDPDGDDVYTATVMIAAGTTSNYTFVNGDWWDDKEQIEGLPCADPDNFNDRLPITFTQDTVINTCFQECTDDLNCSPVAAPVAVTFQVNMVDETTSTDGVFLGANFDGWSGDIAMEDPDGDDTWTVTVDVPVGLAEFKFINGDAWEEMDAVEDAACTMDFGGFVNRVLDVAGTDPIVLDPVCYAACINCTDIGTNDILTVNTMFRLAPSITNGTPVMLYFNEPATTNRTIRISNTIGQVVLEANISGSATDFAIESNELANGLYYVIVESDKQAAIEKFIVSK